MKQQISNIIIAAMICGSSLFALGKFDQESKNYATVHFEKGFQRIGLIHSQITTSKVTLISGKDSKDYSSASSFIDHYKNGENGESLTPNHSFNEGVSIKVSTAIEWEGSASNFTLTTSQKTFTSTEEKPLNVLATLSNIEEIEKQAIAAQETDAARSLTFSSQPKSSLLTSKILNILNKL